MIDDGLSSKCGRKTAISIFFAISLLAFLFCLLSLVSPSWQYANLENGRTEHHHGLWLDCKRDYSFDYGRTREYYETLYRRDMQGSPFDVFYLPQLQCVYKFDYYIDPEDLYDHNHDENRIQNDAYQHLFLGWKIAALVGVGVGVLFSACSILLGICSFCHRTFICATTVLVSISAILSTLGSAIFYIWANYQDNKVIKEEEEGVIYEQVLGWAFYCHLIGTLLHWMCALIGCCATSIAFGKQRAKLVKIEVVENDDGSELLSSTGGQNFKRSFSAVYRVDSSGLRQFEKQYLRSVRKRTDVENNFQRTASVPNIRKAARRSQRKTRNTGSDLFSSTSNITEFTNFGSNVTLNTQQTRDTAQTAPAAVACPVPPIPPTKPLKSALKTPTQPRRADPPPQPPPLGHQYEYCDTSSIGVSSFLGGHRTPSLPPNHPYDEVYETIEPYLEPNSVRQNRVSNSTMSTIDLEKSTNTTMLQKTQPVSGSSQSIPVRPRESTLIDDVAARRASLTEERVRFRTTVETKTTDKEERFLRTAMLPPPPQIPPKPASNIREFGIDLSKETLGTCQIQPKSVETRIDDVATPSARETQTSAQYNNYSFEDSDDLPPPPEIAINTFASKQRSITNLSFRGIPRGTSAAHDVFDRPESIVSVSSKDSGPGPRRPFATLSQHSLVNRRLLNVMPDEVDRSVGSSTILENDTRDPSAASYARDAEVRLNLFMNDHHQTPKNNQDETTV